MKDFIRKHIISIFYFLVLVISGMLLLAQSRIPDAGAYSLSLPQLAPALAVLIVCICAGDKIILWRICTSILPAKKDIPWIAFVLLLTISAVSLTGLILSFFGFPYSEWHGSWVNILVMVCGCFFEEIGWRGFMLPQLERRYNPFASTLIVGFLWGFWHMSFNLGIIGFLVFIITAIEMSVLMTLIFHKTNGNLMLMTLWHVSINILNQVLLTDRLSSFGFAIFAAVLSVFCLAAVLKNQKLYFTKRF